jgi:hypothetical protein
MTKDTGGPAFPTTMHNYGDGKYASDGMTLRDYFAAKSLQGICANPDDSHAPEDETYDQYVDEITRCAYKIAEAMLKAREV